MTHFVKNRSRAPELRALLIPVLGFALIAVVLFAGLDTLDASSRAQQLSSTEEAIRRAAVHCYAVEGRYPPDLDYLTAHYGVYIDSERCVVYYNPTADNLMPDIAVFPLGSK